MTCNVRQGPASFFDFGYLSLKDNSVESFENFSFDSLTHVEVTVTGADIADDFQCQDVQCAATFAS